MSKHKQTRIYEKSVSVSFTMSKSVPTSPDTDKKYVHFAEGEDLVDVKTFVPSYDDLDALRKVFLQKVPLHTRKSTDESSTDEIDGKDEKFRNLKGSSTVLSRKLRFTHSVYDDRDCLSACYDQLQPDEIETKIKQTNVCLSNTRLSGRTVNGFIVVKNLAYEKEVMVRHSFDDWVTILDCPAYYVSSSDEGKRDKFGFNLTFPKNEMEMYFAVQYKVNGKEYWDNNSGNDYKIVDFS